MQDVSDHLCEDLFAYTDTHIQTQEAVGQKLGDAITLCSDICCLCCFMLLSEQMVLVGGWEFISVNTMLN